MTAVLESAVVRDTVYDSTGQDMMVANLDAITAGDLTEAEVKAQSAKLVDIVFRAGGLLALSMPKLREKIEQYMAETYIALFDSSGVLAPGPHLRSVPNE